MHKRQRDIQAGRLEPAEPTSMQDGGKIQMRGKMSLQEYKKNFNNLGTIGQQRIQET